MQPLTIGLKKSSARDVLLAGHSHISCLGVSALSHDNQVTHHNDGPFLTASGQLPRPPSYWDFVLREAQGRDVVIAHQGNQHNSLYMFQPEPPFDFVSTQFPQLPPIEEFDLVPESQVRAKFDFTFEDLRRELPRLSQLADTRIMIIGTPPPRRGANLREEIKSQPMLMKPLERQGLDIETVGFTPPSILMKMWGIIQQEVEKISMASGLTFVPFPKELCDPEGYLSEDFWKPYDSTHMNDAGGAILKRLIQQKLEAFP